MKKMKSILGATLIAFILNFGSITKIRAESPCIDGQVPIGSKTCSLRTETPENTDKEKPESIFEIMIEWFNDFGF